ncbi:MAG: hypothetical protein HEEMFOPI_01226 [Holosporales bacterium]
MRRSILKIVATSMIIISSLIASQKEGDICKRNLDFEHIYKYERGISLIKRATDGTLTSENLLKECSSFQLEENDREQFFTLSTHRQNVLMELNKDNDGRIPVQNPEKSTFKYHAFLDLKFPENNFRGTGTIVGPRHIITAGHNVFGPSWVDQIDVFLSLDENKKPFGKQRVIQVCTYRQWVENLNQDFDIALLILDNPIGLTMGWLSMKALLTPLEAINITIAGYPGYVNEDKVKDIYKEEAKLITKNYRKMWMMSGPMTSFLSKRIGYQIDTSGGQSGSAIFYCDKGGTIYVIGVHTHGSDDKTLDAQNTGTRITESIITDFSKIIEKTSIVRKLGLIVFFDFLEIIKMLRLIHPCLCPSELLMLQTPLMIDQSTQTYGNGFRHHMEIRVEKFEELCSLDRFKGDETALFIKYVLENCFHKTLFIDYLCDPDLATKIEHLFFKKNKILDDIVHLTHYFCWEKGMLPPILNEEHNNGKMRDESFHDYIRTYQIVLLWILSETHKITYQPERQDLLLSEDAEEKFKTDKKNLIQNIISSYKKGSFLLDKSRRFWRDNHKNAGQSCCSVGIILKPTFYQERCFQNGTQSYLTALYEHLHKHYLVVLFGAGGMGKSTLVAQYVDEAQKNNAYGFIGSFNAENEGTLRNSLINAIKKFDIDYTDNDSYSLRDLLWILEKKCREKSIADRNLLFIFDNAESYRALEERNCLPQFKHTIVTTRMDPNDPRYTASPFDVVKSIKLSIFGESEAKSYLKTNFESLLKEPYDEKLLESLCEDISQKLGCYPLALRLAVGYIVDKGVTIENIGHYSKLLARSLDQFQEFIDFSIKEKAESLSKEEEKIIEKSLVGSFSLTYNGLSQQEKDLFHRVCYLQADRVSTETFKDLDRYEDVIKILAKKNVIDLDNVEMSSISLHRLTQEVGRYIVEQTEEFKENKQAFFDKTLISLENEALLIKKSLSLKDVSKDQLLQLYNKIVSLKTSWYVLCEHIKRYQCATIDENAHFMSILQNEIAHKLLQFDSLALDRLLKTQTKLNDDAFQLLMDVYDEHFSSYQDSLEKKQIFIALAKFYENDFTKFIDWTFFEGLPYEELIRRLDVLISTTEDPTFDLKDFFEKTRRHIDEFKSNPYLTLVAIRFNQSRATGTPYVFDEAITFLKNLCTKNITDRNIHSFKHALSLWAKLPPHICVLLEKLKKYDENTLDALLRFPQMQLANLLNLYVDVALHSVGAMASGLESALLISNFPSFYQMHQKVRTTFSLTLQQLEDENYITQMIRQFPSFTSVITDIYFSFVRQGILPEEEAINIPTAAKKVFQKAKHQSADIIFQGYINHSVNLLSTFVENNLDNAVYTFCGLIKHFPFAISSIGLGSSHDGKDNYFILEEYSKFFPLTQDKERLEIIRRKTQECFDIDQTQPDVKVYQIYKMWRIINRIYEDEIQFKTLWENFITIETKDLKPSDRVSILEWYFDNPHSQDLIKQSLHIYLSFGYNVSDILSFYSFYKKHSLDLTDDVFIKFSKIAPYFPNAEDEKNMIGKFLPFISESRLDSILSHAFLKGPFSSIPFAHSIAIAATMDTKFCEPWNQQNPQFSRSTNLWNYWISNPFNMNFYQSYITCVLKLSTTG